MTKAPAGVLRLSKKGGQRQCLQMISNAQSAIVSVRIFSAIYKHIVKAGSEWAVFAASFHI